jgi:uncharacterized damage-inducible protein DinB
MRARTIALLVLATSLSAVARVQQTPAKPVAPKLAGFRGEFVDDLGDVEDKITQLASSFPAEKYSWRPAAGVRSVSEVFMHIAGAVYFQASFVGAQPPADLPQDFERITDKATVLAELKKSFAWARRVVAAESDADLEKSVNLFGKPATHRYVFTTMLNHMHEHLGQSIAYARMNGVIPPWSR